MRRFMINIILLLSALTLFSCHIGQGGDGSPEGNGGVGNSGSSQGRSDEIGSSVSMLARIDKIDDKLEVTVLESEYTFGVHWVITPDETVYFGIDGREISRDSLNVGDTVEILYSGQVMLSMPPQIVAARITVR